MSKLAVQLTKKKRTKYRFQKLKMCKKCNRYSVIKDEKCSKCGSTYIGVEKLAKSIFKNKVFNESILILIAVSLGIIGSPTMKDLYFSLIAGVAFCSAYVILHSVFMKSEYFLQLKKLIIDDLEKIRHGITYDSELAKEDVKEVKLAAAYDKLREIGDFDLHDEIKIRRIMVLNEIAIRKDMELELESLVPMAYDRDFVKYTLDVIKVNRQLVTKNVIAYFITHRNSVERDFGHESLITIAGTALRMKLYIREFSDFIQEFLDNFPKDRLLRLCHILSANSEEDWGMLVVKTDQVVNRKYNYDPDFKAFL